MLISKTFVQTYRLLDQPLECFRAFQNLRDWGKRPENSQHGRWLCEWVCSPQRYKEHGMWCEQPSPARTIELSNGSTLPAGGQHTMNMDWAINNQQARLREFATNSGVGGFKRHGRLESKADHSQEDEEHYFAVFEPEMDQAFVELQVVKARPFSMVIGREMPPVQISDRNYTTWILNSHDGDPE